MHDAGLSVHAKDAKNAKTAKVMPDLIRNHLFPFYRQRLEDPGSSPG
jgi:hypothetical protein